MWREWLYQYNSFNSIKVLAWREQLEEMAKGKLPVPVTVTVDPTNICNVNCIWCIWGDMRRASPTSIPDKVLLEMPDFLKSWGVKSVCIAGGGEPLIHPKIGEFILALAKNNLQIGVITNGLALEKEKLRQIIVDNCRWIGFSVDAATGNTYQLIKRPKVTNAFTRVMDNISWICRNRREKKRPQVGMKYLIHHNNYGEMYQFADMSKTIGADDVHFRPVFIPNYRFTKGVRKTAEFHLRESRKDLEDDNFKVFGIVHKFEREWTRAIRFQKCRATPIAGFFQADGKFSICCDRRGESETSLGKFYPYDEFKKKWGGKVHKELVEKIIPQTCPRCTQAITNEIIEKAIMKDEMTINFP